MPEKVKFFFQQSWLLLVSSVFFGILLAVADAAWQPRIIQNQIEKFNRLASGMLKDAARFETLEGDIEIDIGKGKKAMAEVRKAFDSSGNVVGWAFVCQGSGFADKIKLVVATDAKFEKLAGYGVLFSNETPGFGDRIKTDYYMEQFIGVPAEKLSLSKSGDDKKIDGEIVAITGATVSSEAVVTILNNCVSQVKNQLKLKGLISYE